MYIPLLDTVPKCWKLFQPLHLKVLNFDSFSMLKVLYARSFANYAKRLRLTLLDNFLNVFKENFKVTDPFGFLWKWLHLVLRLISS